MNSSQQLYLEVKPPQPAQTSRLISPKSRASARDRQGDQHSFSSSLFVNTQREQLSLSKTMEGTTTSGRPSEVKDEPQRQVVMPPSEEDAAEASPDSSPKEEEIPSRETILEHNSSQEQSPLRRPAKPRIPPQVQINLNLLQLSLELQQRVDSYKQFQTERKMVGYFKNKKEKQ